jgi:glutamate dehydrogenase/leucine dehydrogenase
MRFCQSYMTELTPFIGQTVDIPAGDLGVGEPRPRPAHHTCVQLQMN